MIVCLVTALVRVTLLIDSDSVYPALGVYLRTLIVYMIMSFGLRF